MLITGNIVDVELFVYGRIIYGKFLKLHDESIRDTGEVYLDENGIKLISASSPAIAYLTTDNIIYIPGHDEYGDNIILRKATRDEEEARIYYDKLTNTLINFNNIGPSLIG